MKIKIIVLIVLAVSFVSIILAKSPDNKYAETVSRHLKEYPETTLRDIYKSFFQDYFGPGHIVEDTVSAKKYLKYELKNMSSSSLPYYEPAGLGLNFYRGNLSIIKDGIMSEDEFFNAFIESADSFSLPPVEEWNIEWQKIVGYIPSELPDYSEDKEMIDSILSEGKYAIHHSRRYNDAYHPHYRIISKKVFEDKILPKIISHIRNSK